MHRFHRWILLLAAVFLASRALAPMAAWGAELDSGTKALFGEHCHSCHGPNLQEGGLRLDQLGTNLEDAGVAARWLRIMERLDSGEMPPKGEARPDAKNVKEVVASIERSLVESGRAKHAKVGRGSLRRLNRVEYEYTLHDLFAIDAPLKERLPEDSLAFGFDIAGQSLGLSSVLLERYLEVADAALDAAIAKQKELTSIKGRFSYEGTNKEMFELNVGSGEDFARVFFLENGPPPGATQVRKFQAPMGGLYRIRVQAYAYQSEKPVTYRVYTSEVFRRPGMESRLLGHFGASLKKDAKPVEFEAKLDMGQTIMVMPYGTGRGVLGSGNVVRP